MNEFGCSISLLENFIVCLIGAPKLRKPPQNPSLVGRTKHTTEPSSIVKPSTLRAPLKYKNIDRPNIKLFPSLHSKQSTTEANVEADSADPSDTSTDFIETTSSVSSTSRNAQIKTATPLKFNSKIRPANRNATVPANIRPQATSTLTFGTPRSFTQHRLPPVNLPLSMIEQIESTNSFSAYFNLIVLSRKFV